MDIKNNFGILGTSIGHGQPKPGVEKAYEYLELIGFWEELCQKNVNLKNFGSLPQEDYSIAYNNLFHKTLEIINSGYKPALIGGDHSQAFATVSALLNKYPDLKILWFDAHADMNTPITSPSGNSHGMPLSGLLGLVDRNIWGMPWMNQLLKPEQVIHIGVRDMDQGEIDLMNQHNIEHYSPSQVREKGLQNILDEISNRWGDSPAHLSFDIDGLDHSLVPATGTPVGDGLVMNDAFAIIDQFNEKLNFVSCEVVEFNPDLAKDKAELETTELNVKKIIEKILLP